MHDILDDLGYLALGSRLKRLAERMQADAQRAHAEAGFPIQCGHFPLLAALDAYGPQTIGELVEALGVSQPSVTRTQSALATMGLTEASASPEDQRVSVIRLTPEGQALTQRMRQQFWPRVRMAAEALSAAEPGDLLTQIRHVERMLDEKPLNIRIRDVKDPTSQLRIRDYEDALAGDFRDITREWVQDMFTLEDKDIEITDDPRGQIIDRGGVILFVETEALGVIGTCALMPVEGGSFELTKMGVSASARGLKAGEFLPKHVLERARSLKIDELFLLTNRKCEAAIHLYEKAGFRHDSEIMSRFGCRYGRCDVAMSYPL